ncbi:MerR family transcriptional regulator [Deinococcus detaillensis]|uniref:MerR family transcriptional regulator n=1 Tax=Deinococcus detaillensis TaxID=2592048 RepID=A0A553V4X7_9DEIO|nr:MerR family transcriptional regulator [Deinococcus detaillensis]TSA87271.1 MerR family transcriptional regulator [Deinococcus detaillensis]
MPRSAEAFGRMVTTYRRRLTQDAQFAAVLEVLCGSPQAVQAFAQASGVGISAFAALVELPPSTVRHYQRLGLITPYEVSGKFRFWFHNIAQVESVRQWRDLGLSLEEIQAQRTFQRLGGQTATFNKPSATGLSVWVTKQAVTVRELLPEQSGAARSPLNRLNSYTVWVPVEEDRQHALAKELFQDADPSGMQRLLSEVSAARQRIEDQLSVLQRRVQRAQLLEAALQHHTKEN